MHKSEWTYTSAVSRVRQRALLEAPAFELISTSIARLMRVLCQHVDPCDEASGYRRSVYCASVDGQLFDQFFKHWSWRTRYPAVGKPSITIVGIELYGLGSQAVVRVNFKGSAKGTLYLVGTPTFDAGRNVLSFPDLDYTVETKNLILRIANWLKHDSLRDDLRSRAVLDVSGEVQRARDLGTQAINRTAGPVTLSGAIGALKVLGLYADPKKGSVVVITAANGTLNALVQ